MNNKIKSLLATGVALLVTLAIYTGCSTIGASPKPPSATEAKLYQVETNFIPATVTVTNILRQTNVVTLTNQVDNTVTTTNVVSVTPVVSQVETNQAVYIYHNNPQVTGTLAALGQASGPFTGGIGTFVAGGLALLYGLWGQARSTKLKGTAVALTQEIEAVRDYILTLPQGTKIDAAVTGFMQQHQVEAGVASQVMTLIEGNTSNPTVVGVSQSLQAAIDELTKPAPANTPIPK